MQMEVNLKAQINRRLLDLSPGQSVAPPGVTGIFRPFIIYHPRMRYAIPIRHLYHPRVTLRSARG